MAEHVISHRRPRRKRGQRSFLLRRFGALAVTIAALATASWLAPQIYRPPPTQPVIELAEAPNLPPKLPPLVEITKTVLVVGGAEPVVEAQRSRHMRRGVPLDARPGDAGEDFEILSAGELDAISQARN